MKIKENQLLVKREVTEEMLNNFNLSKHLIDFLWHEPFYSRLLRSLNKVETEKISTAGVSTENGDITLWWNRKFLAGLKNAEIKGLLKHECLHLVFGHTSTRRRDPNIVWNYSTDLAINSLIPESELPKGGLIPGKPLCLSQVSVDLMSSEDIEFFMKLSDLIESFPKNKTSEFYFNKLNENKDLCEFLAKCSGNSPSVNIGFDSHDDWDNLSEDEKGMIENKIKELVKEAAAEADSRHWGSISSSTRNAISKMISNEIKWESLLKRFCGFTRRDERTSSIRRLNKKYPGVHSGFKKTYKPMVAVYIDESGSVSNNELEKFYSELDSLSNRTDFYIYKFDHEVDEKSSFLWKKRSKPKINRTLTGGTSFDAVAKHAIENKKLFDGYIVLTDGGAPKPRNARGLKRCWVLASNCDLAFSPDKCDIVIKMK